MTNFNSLLPSVKEKAENFVKKLKKEAFPFQIIETRRTDLVQAAYYAQGRETLEEINERRRLAGLESIDADRAKRIITQVRKSKHQEGKALDICPVVNGRALWTMNSEEQIELWKKLGKIGQSCGFVWGGSWKPLDKNGLGWDCPHFETEE